MKKKSFLFTILVILFSSFFNFIILENYQFIHALTYVEITLSLLFCLFLLYSILRIRRSETRIDINITDISVFLFVVYITIRYATSPKYNSMPDNLIFYGLLLCGYFILRVRLSKDHETIKSVFYAIVLGGVFQAVYSILQMSGRLSNFFQFKFGGTFGIPGDLANFLVIPLIISLGLLIYEKAIKLRVLLAVAIILIAAIVVMSKARAAWIAVAVTIVALLFRLDSVKRKLTDILKFSKNHPVFSIISTCILIILGACIVSGLYYMKRPSADGRLFIWKNCIELIKEKPLFGHGYDSFIPVSRANQVAYFKSHPEDKKNGMLAADCSYAFNDYLQQGVEYGFLYLAFFIIILSNLFSLKDPGNFFLSVSKITIAGILICMLFSYPLQNPSIVIAFFMLLSVSSAFDRRVITRFYPGKVFIAASFLTCIIMLVFVALYSVTSIAYGLKWKEADKQSEAKINGYVDNYDRIYDFLKRDRSFILNYGSILNISGNDQRCVAHYEKLGYMCPSAVMYMLLAESYFKLKDFEKAEENYKNASCMVPYLFYPKYKLFRLYQYQGKDKEALKIARQISKMDIKVYSNIVGDIKAEINKYLLNKTITNETAN